MARVTPARAAETVGEDAGVVVHPGAAEQRWLASSEDRSREGPPWSIALADALAAVDPAELSRNDPPATTVGPRQAAVLILLGDDAASGPFVLLQQRAARLRDHAGEVAFPGGGREPDDTGPVGTALREAAEETGLDPAGVEPLARLPRLHIPYSGFDVTPVLARWRAPVALAPVDRGETRSVFRVPLAELADPAHRVTVRIETGWRGPAFTVAGVVVWGFTGELVAAVLRHGGWERAWDTGQVMSLEEAWDLARLLVRR